MNQAAEPLPDEFAELVELVRDDPLIELDVEPELDLLVRFEALTLEQQAHELNSCESAMGGASLWVVAGGMVVAEGSTVHREIVKQERRARALSSRRLSFGAIARPLVRVRERGRARRGRRVTLRCTPARSPGRPAAGDDDDLAELVGAAA